MNDLIKTQQEKEERKTTTIIIVLLVYLAVTLQVSQYPFIVLYNTAPCFLDGGKNDFWHIRLLLFLFREKEESLVTFRQNIEISV